MFNEDLNTAVLTTRFVFNDRKPILSVFHHAEDNMWEFLSEEISGCDADFMVVSLGEMIQLDPSIETLADLPLGKCAIRANVNSQWVRV